MQLWRALTNFVREDIPFYLAKLEQMRVRRVDPSLTDRPDVLDTLVRDGVAMVENFFDAGEVASIVDEIYIQTDLLATRQSPKIVKRLARYLYVDAPRDLPATRRFFDSPLVNGIARAYLSTRVVLDRPAVQLKCEPGQDSIVDFFHIDEWRYLISAFVFLNDIGPDQAPLVYLKGSHRASLWRLPKEREFYAYYDRRPNGTYGNEESPYCGCFLPTETRRLREKNGFEELFCTGKAGTLLIFDNLGLHRSSVLRSGHRLILSGYWMLPKSAIGRAA